MTHGSARWFSNRRRFGFIGQQNSLDAGRRHFAIKFNASGAGGCKSLDERRPL